MLLAFSLIACGFRETLAGPIEDSVFAAFEAICIEPINKPDQIAAMVQDVGATQLNEQEARPFLNSQPGRAWMMRDKNARLLITLTTKECAAYLDRMPLANPSKVLLANICDQSNSLPTSSARTSKICSL
jgi:hypothetical protein